MFGEDLYAPILNFPKKIVSVNGNAKLLSANDSTNFTYRGRFASKEEALQVDGETSQKIHSTLQWLVNNHGTITDTQVIVICSVKNPNEKPKLDPQEGSYDFGSLFSSDVDEPEAPRNDIADALTATNFQYAQVFRRYYADMAMLTNSKACRPNDDCHSGCGDIRAFERYILP